MAFLRNAWYMAGWASELEPGSLLARTICDDPIVLYRDATGQVAALEDRCCHRHYPLSAAGEVIGANLQCGYHGFQYDGSGRCVKIPSQAQIPENARVRSYPLIERHRCLWIWMGDPSRADAAQIPELGFLDDPAWGWRGTLYPVKGSYKFVIENLLDLTHLTFVHASTIGNYALIDSADVKTVRGDKDVQVNRWMPNSEPPPSYVKAAGFNGKVDRWQLIRYTMPAVVRLWTGAAPHGRNARDHVAPHGAPHGEQMDGLGMFNLNFMTPETERSTHYFWAQGQDVRPADQALNDSIFGQIEIAFRQDWAVFEAQQLRTDQAPQRPRIDVGGDAGGMQAIQMLERAIQLEQQPSQQR